MALTVSFHGHALPSLSVPSLTVPSTNLPSMARRGGTKRHGMGGMKRETKAQRQSLLVVIVRPWLGGWGGGVASSLGRREAEKFAS